MKKVRDSNFELLRIFAMLLIICCHYSVHSSWKIASGFNFKRLVIDSLPIGEIGVTIFVIISGYFLINSKTSIKKIITLSLQTIFYGLLFCFIFDAFKNAFSGNPLKADYIRSLFPITYQNYWFVSSYILMYIFINPINKLIKSINQKQFKQMLLIIFVLFFVVNNSLYFLRLCPIFNWYNIFSLGNDFLLIYFYMIGAYFRLYNVNIKRYKCIIMFVLT